MLLRNEQLSFGWGVGYNGNMAVMKNAEAVDTFWYLEEVGVPYHSTSHVSSTSVFSLLRITPVGMLLDNIRKLV